MLSQVYYVIIGRGVRAPVHGRDVLDGLIATDKRFLFRFMETLQLPGSTGCYTHMAMHSTASTSDVSLARQFRKHLSNASLKRGVIDQGQKKK